MVSETMNLLLNRKSVRVYEDKPIAPEIKQAILKAAMQSPTAGNLMLYSILDITDQAIKDTLAVSCDHQPFIATAPLVLIFVADYRRWYDKWEQIGCADGELRTPDMGDLLLACSDALIAAQTAVIAAESFGIGSCYIGDILEQAQTHRELLHLPTHTLPVTMLCFGYPTEQQKSRISPQRFPQEMIVFENQYQQLNTDQLDAYQDDEKARRLYTRKYISDYTQEMNRSAQELIQYWKS